MYGVDGKRLQVQYKEHISSFNEWDQLYHSCDYALFAQNLGECLSMDETCLSQGELYTIVTNKSAKGGRGSLVAMIKGTKSDTVLHYLHKMPDRLRRKVREITIDLSPMMKIIAKKAFPNASMVSDRFHVQKLMNEAISDLRVDYRWEAIKLENSEIELAKEFGAKFVPKTFRNGDTRRQLLARSRHIVMKNMSKWTKSQAERAEILFEEYPEIEYAYKVSMELTNIYNKTNDKGIALTRLAKWYNTVESLNSKFFNSVIDTMKNNYPISLIFSTRFSISIINNALQIYRRFYYGICSRFQ